MWEKDPAAAWAYAHEGSCERSLLIALAGKLEASRPGDAVSLYLQDGGGGRYAYFKAD